LLTPPEKIDFALGEPINCSTQFRVFLDLALEKPVNRLAVLPENISKSNPNIGSARFAEE
jgi:hypothetical protein